MYPIYDVCGTRTPTCGYKCEAHRSEKELHAANSYGKGGVCKTRTVRRMAHALHYCCCRECTPQTQESERERHSFYSQGRWACV